MSVDLVFSLFCVAHPPFLTMHFLQLLSPFFVQDLLCYSMGHPLPNRLIPVPINLVFSLCSVSKLGGFFLNSLCFLSLYFVGFLSHKLYFLPPTSLSPQYPFTHLIHGYIFNPIPPPKIIIPPPPPFLSSTLISAYYLHPSHTLSTRPTKFSRSFSRYLPLKIPPSFTLKIDRKDNPSLSLTNVPSWCYNRDSCPLLNAFPWFHLNFLSKFSCFLDG